MIDLPLDRREFHTSLVKGAALLGLSAATANVSRADDATPNVPEKEVSEVAEKALSPAALIVELTKQTFPHDQMSEDFLAALQSYVELNLIYSETLDNYGLTNGDPPGPMMYFPP